MGPFWPLGPQYGREGALLALGAMGKQTFRVTGKKELRVTGKWASGFRAPGRAAIGKHTFRVTGKQTLRVTGKKTLRV